MQVFCQLNMLVENFIKESLNHFPDIPDLKKDYMVLLHAIHLDKGSKLPSELLKINLDKVSEHIHVKNDIIFNDDITEYQDVSLIKMLHLKEIYEKIEMDDHDHFWVCTQNIVKQLGLVLSVGNCIPCIANIFQTFQSQNKSLNMKDPKAQKIMMEQMLTNPILAQEVTKMFNDTNPETSILANIAPKMRALGLTKLNTDNRVEEVVNEDDEEKEKEEEKEEKVENENRCDEEPSASSILKQTLQKRKKNKNQKPKSNIFADVAKSMENQDMNSSDLVGLRAELAKVFSGTNTNQAEIKAMMENAQQKGMEGMNNETMMQAFQKMMSQSKK